MASIGDIYEIVDEQMFDGQKCLNVYFYRVTATTLGADASDVTAAYIAQVIPLLLPVQVDNVVHVSVRARNLFDDTDAHEELIAEEGAGTGDPLGTFEAYGFRETTDNAAIRAGAKRITGVPEDASTDGVITASGVLSDLDDIATQLATTLLYGLLDAGTLVPVVVGRILDGGSYRLPENIGEAIFGVIVDALFTPLVTSQVSRKVGRGE